MQITNQEKINLSYVFISAYENIVNLIKPIHNNLSDLLKGVNKNYNDLIFLMYKIFTEKYKNKKILKIKDTHNLLVDVNIFSNEDLILLIKLSKIRNAIGHESLNIYFNENINFDYFMLEDLLKLYKKLFNKILTILEIDATFQSNKILNEHKFNYQSIIILINNLFTNSSFYNLTNILN